MIVRSHGHCLKIFIDKTERHDGVQVIEDTRRSGPWGRSGSGCPQSTVELVRNPIQIQAGHRPVNFLRLIRRGTSFLLRKLLHFCVLIAFAAAGTGRGETMALPQAMSSCSTNGSAVYASKRGIIQKYFYIFVHCSISWQLLFLLDTSVLFSSSSYQVFQGPSLFSPCMFDL